MRRGSFGCRTLGKPGQEPMALHEHHACGDECVAVQLSDELAESLGAGRQAWDLARSPPLRTIALSGIVQRARTNLQDASIRPLGTT